MRIRWSPEAADDFERIIERITRDNPGAARRIAKTIFESVESLSKFPYRGRIGRFEESRELVLSPLPYIAIYRISGDTVEVARIYHGAQLR